MLIAPWPYKAGSNPLPREIWDHKKNQTWICLTVPLLFLSRAMFSVKSSVTQLRILRVCLPQEQAPSPEQVISWFWCVHILWAHPGPGGQGIPDYRAPHQGTRERAPPQDPCQGRGNAATLKCLRTNLITIPDLNCTCLVSVQQNHFCPHGVVSAETPLHYLYFLFYSSGMFFRWGLSTWTAWGMEGKVSMWKTDSAGSSTVTSWYWGAAGWAWAAALPGSACTGLQHWLSVLKSLLLWVKDTAVNHTSPGTEIFFV